MKRILLALAAAFSLVAVLAVVKPTPALEMEALKGTWLATEGTMDGTPLATEVLKAITLKLDQNKYEVTVVGAPQTDNGTFTVDPTQEPKKMVIKGVTGPNAGKTFPCIYELDGDTLKVCYDLSGQKTPTEFKSVAGTQLYLAVYSRKKS